jgi:hypothetical protein
LIVENSNVATTKCNDGVCEVATCDGNYIVSSSKTKCVECNAPSDCTNKPANANTMKCEANMCKVDTCKTGYTGTNCNECADNYSKDDDGTCNPINEPTSCGTSFVNCTEQVVHVNIENIKCEGSGTDYTCTYTGTCNDKFADANGDKTDGCETSAGTSKTSCGSRKIDCESDSNKAGCVRNATGTDYVCKCNSSVTCSDVGQICSKNSDNDRICITP